MAQVLVDEEGCVGITRLDDLLVAVFHDVQISIVAVAHSDETGQQAPFGGLHREIALVLLHYRDEHFRRQAQM